MLSTGAPSAAAEPFDINKFEDLLNRLEASKRQQKANANAAAAEAAAEPMSPTLYWGINNGKTTNVRTKSSSY